MFGDFLQKDGKVRGNGNGNGHHGNGWRFVDKWGVVLVVITLFSGFVFVDKWLQQREENVIERARTEARKDTEHLKAIMELRLDRLERKIDRIADYIYEVEQHDNERTQRFREY